MAKKLEHDNGTVRDASDGDDDNGSKVPDNVSEGSDDE